MQLVPQLTAIHFSRLVIGGRKQYIESLKKVIPKEMCTVKSILENILLEVGVIAGFNNSFRYSIQLLSFG